MKFVAAALFASAQAIVYDKYSNLISLYQTNDAYASIDIELDGETKTYYIATDEVAQSGAKSDIRVPSNGRGYIIETPSLDYNNPQYFRPNLKNAIVEYDIDLSDHECGCVAAFYTVSMPGKMDDGSLWMDTDGFGYCDANMVDGNWCPEMDLMEANKYSWASTPHTCDAPNDKGHHYHCDTSGTCALNIYDQLAWNGYGPGSDHVINTDQPFHVKINLGEHSFSTILSQNGQEQNMTCHGDYFAGMANDLEKGQVFVISNWGGDASWLWHDRCSGSCNWPELTISNIKITSGATPTPVDPYNPADYDFGDSCATAHDDDCEEQTCPSVFHCRWSWSKTDADKWAGHSAHCRCDIA